MRILIISHSYVSKYHQEKIEELARHKDLGIFLMVPEFGIEGGGRKIYLEKTKDENYTIIPIRTYFSGKWNSYLIKGLKNYLRKIKPDVIHLEEEYWTNVAWQVARTKNKATKLILFTWENIYHDWSNESKNIYQKLRFKIFSAIEKKVLQNTDLVIAGNKEATEVLKKNGFKKPIEIVPQLGVNANYFKNKNSDELKKELGLEQCFVVGYIGRIAKEKGIEDLIKATAGFSQKTAARVKFLIIGNGHYKPEAQELVKKLGLEQSFVFVPSVDFNQIVEYYNLMDLMVIPSRTTPEWKEQFGRTIIEAMSCGIPVVGSDSGAIPEVIGDAGLIFQEGNTDDLADKIIRIIDENELRIALIANGLKRVRENFTTEIIAKKTYEIYRAVESSL